MSEITEAQRDKLMAHLKGVVADAEELLKFTAGDVGEGTTGLRQRLQDGLAQSRQSLFDLQTSATDKARAAGHATDDYVHDHPWQAVALGAGVGLVVGLLIGRR